AVRVERRDNIIVAVAIHIVSKHLRAALAAELEAMFDPECVLVLRLFPPAVVQEQIEASIAIHITHASSVIELLPLSLCGDGFDRPRSRRMLPIRMNQTPLIIPMRHQLRLAIAIDIQKRRRFALDPLEDEMLLPEPGLAARILIPEGLMRVNSAQDQNIRPA